jgi:biopolymer transport protein ExbD
MCDVAFLLLTFFILATEFKPEQAVAVTTPTSVQKDPVPPEEGVLVSISPDGKVFLNIQNPERRQAVLEDLNKRKSLGMSDAEIAKANALPFFGAPVTQLKSSLSVPADKYISASFPGIPAKDSANNEVTEWMQSVVAAYKGEKMNLLLKGDMNSKYPYFKNVITAFKKNNLMKFQMVTNPENVPTGTELFLTPRKKT